MGYGVCDADVDDFDADCHAVDDDALLDESDYE